MFRLLRGDYCNTVKVNWLIGELRCEPTSSGRRGIRRGRINAASSSTEDLWWSPCILFVFLFFSRFLARQTSKKGDEEKRNMNTNLSRRYKLLKNSLANIFLPSRQRSSGILLCLFISTTHLCCLRRFFHADDLDFICFCSVAATHMSLEGRIFVIIISSVSDSISPTVKRSILPGNQSGRRI